MKRFLSLLLCLLLLTLPALAEEAAPAPIDFSLTTVTGENFTLSDLRGKVVVLNFWGTWCGWCLYEMPAINDLAVRYADAQDVAVVTVNYGDSPADAAAYLAAEGYTHFIVPCDLTGEAAMRLGIEGFPTTLLLDKEGIPAETIVGVQHPVDEICEAYSKLIEPLR